MADTDEDPPNSSPDPPKRMAVEDGGADGAPNIGKDVQASSSSDSGAEANATTTLSDPPAATTTRPVSSSPDEGPGPAEEGGEGGDKIVSGAGEDDKVISHERDGTEANGLELDVDGQAALERSGVEDGAAEAEVSGPSGEGEGEGDGPPASAPAASKSITARDSPDHPVNPSTTAAASGGIHVKLTLHKKRKRKTKSSGSGGMVAFGDDDDDDGTGGGAKRRLPALELADVTGDDGDRDNVSSGGDVGMDDGDEQEGAPSSSSSSIRRHAVPPARVMSPMPQREEAGTPPCPSPNAPAEGAVPHQQQQQQQQQQIMAQKKQQQHQRQGTVVQQIMAQKQQQQQRQQQPQRQGTVVLKQTQQAQQYAQQQLQHRFQSASHDGNSSAQGAAGQPQPHPQPRQPQPQQQPQQQQQQQQLSHPHGPTTRQQPPGWRVKLYRLNPDGTWDDCGTGRIQFYHAKPPRPGAQAHGQPGPNHNGAGGGPPAAEEKGDGTEPSASDGKPTTKVSLFRELGEPMLCMRAEAVPPPHQRTGGNVDGDHGGEGASSPSSSPQNKVLLRTRVLLHDAYQCQGGNIITWCEPCGQPPQSKANERGFAAPGAGDGPPQQPQGPAGAGAPNSSASVPAGVDLALSFQDNAGCRDVWQKITEAQSRARELANRGNGGSVGSASSASAGSTHGSAANGGGLGGGLSISRPHHEALPHPNQSLGHHHRPHSPHSPKQLHGSPPSQPHSPLHAHHHHHHHHHGLLNAPNSPDHDALEDRQLHQMASAAAAAAHGHHPLGIAPRPPLLSAKDVLSSSTTEGGSTVASIGPSPSSSLVERREHRLHVHNHAASASARPSSPKTHNLDRESVHQFHLAEAAPASAVEHEATAVSVAAAAAASLRESTVSANGERGARSADDDDENPGPSPLAMMPGGEGDGDAAAPAALQAPQRGFSPLQFHPAGSFSSTLSTLIAQQLPNDPKWEDLPTVSELIATWSGQFQQQREELLAFLARDDCAYVRKLLGMFAKDRPAHPANEEELRSELALVIKSILLLNDPEIIEYVTSAPSAFESACAILEYDPELRRKADHISFLRNGAKFRTVVYMDDEELVGNVHRLFRVNYLKDVCLRPTMDEGSLSTLVSLGQFTMSDIVKGVVAGGRSVQKEDGTYVDNYLIRMIRMLGTEVRAIQRMKWEEIEGEASSQPQHEREVQTKAPSSPPPDESPATASGSIEWRQHLVPQDGSLPSRLFRRKGCLLFLNELFNMARLSLQQHEKDDFIESMVSMVVLVPEEERGTNDEKNTTDAARSQCVNLLSLLGGILCDPTTDAKERGAALDILGVIAMHEPGMIRKSCLDHAATSVDGDVANDANTLPPRPETNAQREVLFLRPTNDLLLSLIFAMGTESDAGLLLQASEIIRIVLDTEMVGEGQGAASPMGGGGFLDEENDINAANNGGMASPNDNNEGSASSGTTESEQNSFLALFYDRYIPWLAAPFQYGIVVPKMASPPKDALDKMREEFKERTNPPPSIANASECSPFLETITLCPVRSSFALEVLSFCIRAHVHRMKFFVLRTRLLGALLKILGLEGAPLSGLRCLKLAVLKLLRSVFSVKDEFYHRHIVQYNLFAPVFDLFKSNDAVGSNLISSAILEMCDFICLENIKSLIDHIVLKHLSKKSASADATAPSKDGGSRVGLEEYANPHVDTFKQLRKAYEDNNADSGSDSNALNGGRDGLLMMNGRGRSILNKKALEDQRKFREADEEESYFNEDEEESDVLVGAAPVESKPQLLDDNVQELMQDVKSLD